MGETKVSITDLEFLAHYYIWLILGFSLIESLSVWTDTYEHNFGTLNNHLTSALVLSLLEGHNDFVVYSNASGIRLNCVLMQRGRMIA